MGRETSFIFAGGGTGGHLFPGIAVAEALRNSIPAARLLFACSGRQIERTVLAAYDFESVIIPSADSTELRRRPWKFLWKNCRGYQRSRTLLRDVGPAAVIGLGGFASVPTVIAASQRNIAVMLLEQNLVPGRATRWLARYAEVICSSFDDFSEWKAVGGRVEVTGNPVRDSIATLSPHCDDSPISPPVPAIIVLGGSQGATAVNRAFLDAAVHLNAELANWRIVHQTGPQDQSETRRRYAELGLSAEVEAFFPDLPQRLATANLAVSRAGATTLAELACAGCPAVLIPYPNSVGDHQLHNARYFELRGGAAVVAQDADAQFTAKALAEQLWQLLTQHDLRRTMHHCMLSQARPDAARVVAGRVLSICEHRLQNGVHA